MATEHPFSALSSNFPGERRRRRTPSGHLLYQRRGPFAPGCCIASHINQLKVVVHNARHNVLEQLCCQAPLPHIGREGCSCCERKDVAGRFVAGGVTFPQPPFICRICTVVPLLFVVNPRLCPRTDARFDVCRAARRSRHQTLLPSHVVKQHHSAEKPGSSALCFWITSHAVPHVFCHDDKGGPETVIVVIPVDTRTCSCTKTGQKAACRHPMSVMPVN